MVTAAQLVAQRCSQAGGRQFLALTARFSGAAAIDLDFISIGIDFLADEFDPSLP